MKEVLELIEQKKQEFAKLPFFEFLGDESIDPRQRLVWAPCFAHLVMSFGELNRRVLRKEPADTAIQQLINNHTYEDEIHWLWLLEDIEKLGFNHQLKFTDALRFLWGNETEKTRNLSHELLTLCTTYDNPVFRLVVIESVEATGNIGLTLIAEVAEQLQKTTQQEYLYFGSNHIRVETGHTMGTENVEEIINNIHLTQEEKVLSFYLVEKVFTAFTDCINEQMVYANNRSLSELFIPAYSNKETLMVV